MKSLNVKSIELLESAKKLIRAIDNELDWFIASFKEKDLRKRAIARYFLNRKRRELTQLAREAYEKYR